MTSVFQPADRRLLAAAYGELTHAQMNTYELGLDYKTDPAGTKADRAAELIGHIFDEPEPDVAILEMLDYIYIDSPESSWRRDGTVFPTLKKRVLDPRGITLNDAGFRLAGTAISEPSRTTAPRSLPTKLDGFAARPPADRASGVAPQPAPAASDRDARRIFVVHGRDTRPVEVVSQFLLFIGLRAMAWSDARKLTGKTSPTTYEIVKAGMAGAAAVIVIFSPDDEARLDPRLAPDEPVEKPTGQARQNVILEAGMAIATDPGRTVFVQSERTRPISDIEGINWVRLDGKWDSRQDLYQRLRDAGAHVVADPGNLAEPQAGPFQISTRL